jgi:AraC-like DNA-binding protein
MPVDLKRFGKIPSSGGLISRLAFARLKQAGIEVTPLLKEAKLTAEEVNDRKARLSVQSQISFVELAADALHDDVLGFHMARDFDVREIGLLHYVAASSDTIGDALQRIVRYSRCVSEGVPLGRAELSDSLVVSFKYVGVPRHLDRQQIEFWVTTVVRECRGLSGRRVVPTSMKLAHRRRDTSSELDEFVGIAIEFGVDVDEVALPRTVKEMPVVTADPYLNELLIAYCEETLGKRALGSGGVLSDVEKTIALLLPHGKARLDEVARRLGISRRTLARQLAAEGVTFTGVLSRLRLDLAQRHIRDPDLSISQIAWLLGYQEVSAFTHAFKRWTGRTPRATRSSEGVARR